MSDTQSRISTALICASICLSVGIATAGYFVGNTLYKSRIAANTASVKGLAERDVRANIAVWTINFGTEDVKLETVYANAQNDQSKVVKFLLDNGFSEKEIGKGALTVQKNEHRNDQTGEVKSISYGINASVTLRSENVDKVADIQQRIGDLVGQGVLITNSAPTYLYTKLNDIKPEMLGEATRNARIAAEQFAKDANAKVGKIESATQGAFDFAARDSSGEYQDHSTAIDKTIRVVTTITFYLED